MWQLSTLAGDTDALKAYVKLYIKKEMQEQLGARAFRKDEVGVLTWFDSE